MKNQNEIEKELKKLNKEELIGTQIQRDILQALLQQNKEIVEVIKEMQKLGHDGKEKIYYINAEELQSKLIGGEK